MGSILEVGAGIDVELPNGTSGCLIKVGDGINAVRFKPSRAKPKIDPVPNVSDAMAAQALGLCTELWWDSI